MVTSGVLCEAVVATSGVLCKAMVATRGVLCEAVVAKTFHQEAEATRGV